MIIKSYEINKIKDLNINFFLLYGENQGLKEECISNNFKKNYLKQTYTYNENEIINNEENFYNQILSNSFFENKKLIIIFRATDKILNIIEDLKNRKISDIKIILNSSILEKKSKLRKLFETDSNMVCIPFYKETDQTLIKFVQEFLRNKKINISQESINILVNRSNNDRINLKNELLKIESFAKEKQKIEIDDILKLTNLAENYSIFELVDSVLSKNKRKSLDILNENNFSIEDNVLILRTFLSKLKRLLKIYQVLEINKNIEKTIASIKPPIFWKEKEIVKRQIKLLNKDKVQELIIKTNDIELLTKRKPNLSINIVSNFILEQAA